MRKKFLDLLLATIMTCTMFTACGSSADTSSSAESVTVEDEDVATAAEDTSASTEDGDIPTSVTDIDESTIVTSTDILTIYAPEGSAAEEYAHSHDINFVAE